MEKKEKNTMSWIIISEIYLSGVYIYILIEFIVRCHCLRPIENNIVLSLRISSEKQGIASEELENGTRQVYDKKNKRAKKIYKYIFASVFVIPVFVVRCIGDERKKKEKKKGREKKISIIIIITQAFEVTNMECSLFSCVVCAFISIAITHSSIVNTTISSNTVDYLTSFLFLFNT